MSQNQAAIETFEEELASIKEKGKDLKGEQRVFYQSIVERVSNNAETLAELRSEHTQLRAKLAELVKEKQGHKEMTTLEGDLRHTSHEVNLLQKQIDKIKNEREKSVNRQAELEIILANFKNAAETVHPEEARIADMKNKLDRANIKNGETMHLMKIYQKIIHLLDKQKMHWTPIVQKVQEDLNQKDRDIDELGLIWRDSKFSKNVAKSEYIKTQQKIAQDKKVRTSIIDNKLAQQLAIQRQTVDAAFDANKPSRTQQSLNSQPSVLRNKLNKAAREKREERFRQVSSVYEEVRDRFGTNDPDKISMFFTERKEQCATLQKQIDELKSACRVLQSKSVHLKSAIEEAEYSSSKGVGGSRLLAEGTKILCAKRDELATNMKEMSATAQNQKNIEAGSLHIADVMALVQSEDDEKPVGTLEILRWVKAMCQDLKAKLAEEDIEYLSLVNKPQFAALYAASEKQYSEEDGAKKVKRDFKARATKEKTLDSPSRVLDRNQIKMQAAKTVQLAQQQAAKKKP